MVGVGSYELYISDTEYGAGTYLAFKIYMKRGNEHQYSHEVN